MALNTPTLAKHGKVGFQLQEPLGNAEGINISSVTPVWVPLCEDPSFKLEIGSSLIDMADAHENDYLEYSTGHWYAGSIAFYLYPGILSDLMDWVQTRTTGNQSEFAHVWMIDMNGDLIRGAKDVKVASAEFTFAYGQPIRCTLDLVGKTHATAVPTIGDPTEAITDAFPFLMKDGSFAYTTYSGGSAIGFDIKEATVRLDNRVQDPSAGMRWNGSYSPYTLYNEGGVSCTGSFTRDFQNSSLYDTWLKQHEIGSTAGYDYYDTTYDSSFTITISRGVTFTITMPRVRLSDVRTGQRGSRVGTQDESAEFIALGSNDGNTGPITLA